MIIDQYDLILAGTDGGDSCNRMYTSYIRLALQINLGIIRTLPEPFKRISSPHHTNFLLEIKPGIYVRNPDPNGWYSDPRNFSRDQMTPIICYNAIMTNKPNYLTSRQEAIEDQNRLLKACIKRAMFAQNIYPNGKDPRKEVIKKKLPDFLDPSLWGIFARTYIKTLWAPIAFPIILLGDMMLILASIIKVFAPMTTDGTLQLKMPGPDDVDDDNINNCLMATQYVFPTPFSWLARKVYKKYRRSNFGNTELGEKDPVMGALMWYHHKDNPEIAEIARPLVKRY